MIRKMTESDRDLYIEMAEEFYHSDAVLHPIPRAHFEKTAEEALKSGTYAEIYLLEYEGKTAGYGLTARTFFSGSGRAGAVDRGTVYKGSIPFQRAGQRVLFLSGRKQQRGAFPSET